jgi:hypothetical protein
MATENTDISNIPGVDTLPTTDPETSSELDKLLLEATEGKGEDIAADAPPEDKVETKPEDKKDDAAPADKKDDAAPADKKADPEPDELDKVELPQNTKPKTGEAFSEVKRVAREKISLLVTKTKELEGKVAELESKTKDGGLTPELKTELDELRGFRAKMDVEADPAFKTFDTKAAEVTESIYAKLIAGGATVPVIEKIKSLGGINEVNWEPILRNLPDQIRRSVEAKLVEVEDLGERKNKAIKEAKENAGKYLAQKQEQSVKFKEISTQKALAYGEKLLAETEWMKPKQVPSGATPAEKAKIEDHNKFLKDASTAVAEAAKDDSPEMRAALGLGVAELLKVRRDFAEHKSSSEAQIKELEKNLKEAQTLLEKIKKGSTQRLRNTPASDEPTHKATNNLESGADAIDRMAREAAAGGVPA